MVHQQWCLQNGLLKSEKFSILIASKIQERAIGLYQEVSLILHHPDHIITNGPQPRDPENEGIGQGRSPDCISAPEPKSVSQSGPREHDESDPVVDIVKDLKRE